MLSLLPILPPTICLGAALAALVAGERRGLLAAVAVVAQTALGLVWLGLCRTAFGGTPSVHRLGGWSAPVGIVFVADRLSVLFLGIALAVFCAALVYLFLDEETGSRSRVLALVFLLQMGIVGGFLTGDLFDFYVFFELMGLSSYGLVGYRRGEAHVEAALKYAALSLAGSTLMLMGIGAIYAQTGQLSFAALHDASQVVDSPPLYLFAIALVLASLSLKCALVPLHFWLPDAHSIAPTAISVLLSGALVKLGAYGILRLLGNQAPWVWEDARGVLLTAGAGTAAFAALVAVGQRDLKRVLAWSTASQMGYVVVAAALGSAAGVAAAVVHAAAHAVTKSTLFLGAGTAIDATGEHRWDRMGGLIRRSPLLAAAVLGAFLSLAGIPPLAGFAGKLAIFAALIDERAWAPLLCLLGASALMIYLAVRVWLGLFGGEDTSLRAPARGKVLVTASMAIVTLAVGVAGGVLFDAAQLAAGDLFSGSGYREAVLGTLAPPEVGR